MASSAQRLVAFVALHERAVPRLHASGALWAESSERRANSSLRSALWRVPSPAGVEVIEASDTHLWLNPRVSVDFKETVAWATSILDPTGTAQQPHDPGLQVLRDDLLPEWYEDWVLVERERFRQLRLHALEAICERFTEEGKYGLALEAGLAAVAAEPLREKCSPIGGPSASQGGQPGGGIPPVPGLRTAPGRRSRGSPVALNGPAVRRPVRQFPPACPE